MCSGSEIAGVAVDWMMVRPLAVFFFFFFQPIHGYFIMQISEISYTTAIAVYASFFFFFFLFLQKLVPLEIYQQIATC